MTTPETIEKTGPSFSLERVLAARKRAFEAMAAIAAKIKPGMLEEDAHALAKAELEAHGAERHWHRPYVRFGRNTLKMYGEPSEPGVRLGEDDVFFLDFGPVFAGHEGDCGDTYVTGNDPEMAACASDARKLFDRVAEEWRGAGKSGAALYLFAEAEARRMGWALNVNVGGHRLSDFPHALYFKGALNEVDLVPKPHLWVLEIQLRHPAREFGAFYEDLLV